MFQENRKVRMSKISSLRPDPIEVGGECEDDQCIIPDNFESPYEGETPEERTKREEEDDIMWAEELARLQ